MNFRSQTNERRLSKKLWTDLAEGNRVTVLQCKNTDEESAVVAKLISDLHKTGKYRWGDIAILYRLRNVSPPFEKQLKNRSIPYTAVGKVSLTEREEIKDILVRKPAMFTMHSFLTYTLLPLHS